MKKSRFTEEHIVSILRETDRDTVPVVAKRHGVSEQSIYTWKAPSHRLGPPIIIGIDCRTRSQVRSGLKGRGLAPGP
jgi:transposase